ncbi:MAG: hypothetical protein OXI63_24820 [Candidatus Poribacteria bacterium]|nr:hypothetical protein [Candidatus Poribacteria bacterium]
MLEHRDSGRFDGRCPAYLVDAHKRGHWTPWAERSTGAFGVSHGPMSCVETWT